MNEKYYNKCVKAILKNYKNAYVSRDCSFMTDDGKVAVVLFNPDGSRSCYEEDLLAYTYDGEVGEFIGCDEISMYEKM